MKNQFIIDSLSSSLLLVEWTSYSLDANVQAAGDANRVRGQ